MTSKLALGAIISEHYDTLRDGRTGQVRHRDYLLQLGLPLVAAVSVPLIGYRLAAVAELLAGAGVLAGFTFGLLIFVFQLRLSAQSDPRVTSGGQLVSLIDELFHNVAYALAVAFVGVLAAVIAVALVRPDDSGEIVQINYVNGWWTLLLTFLAVHYLLLMMMCTKRTLRAYSALRHGGG